MSTGSRPSLSPGKFDGSRRRQSVEPRRPLQGVASLEPRICCSRGDTERQVGAGSCCLLQRKSQASLKAGKVVGSRVLQMSRSETAVTYVDVAVRYLQRLPVMSHTTEINGTPFPGLASKIPFAGRVG